MKKLVCCIAALGWVASASLPLLAQGAVTSDEILQSLKPKPRTRGLAAPTVSPADAAFLNEMKHTTRGLTIEERTQVSTIATAAALPSIDLEINFAINSATIDPAALATLQKLGVALKSPELNGGSFLIAGHTDARGAKDYNQKLSEERARTVKAFLASNYPLSSEQLLAVGYGQEQLKNSAAPLADENRRVKIINLGKN